MIFRPALSEPRNEPATFELAAAAPAIGDRQFDDAKPGARHPHLHFQIPAVSHLAHAERQQGVAADGAERAHVGVAHAVEQFRQPAGKEPGEKLMRRHAAGFALAAGARGDDEIGSPGAQRRHQGRDGGRIVGAVAIHENDDVGVGGRLRAGETGAAVAAADRDHFGAGVARAFWRAVTAAAVGDDHPADDVARQFGDHGGDGFRFIEGRNDDGHARRLRRHRLQAPAQSAAGAGFRRGIRFERLAEIGIGRPGPDFAQALLGGVAERVILVAALRERRDAARQRAAVGGEIHHRPRPAAQRPGRARSRAVSAALEADARLRGAARGAEFDAERAGKRGGAVDMDRLLAGQALVERLIRAGRDRWPCR